jgi:hypothetical protein
MPAYQRQEDVIQDFTTKDVVELRRNGFVPTQYMKVYRVTNADGTKEYYLATGGTGSYPNFNPPRED